MFGCDIHNSDTGADVVWNYPIYELTKAEYTEQPGQSNGKVLEIKCHVKYWNQGDSESLYYWYNITYGASGIATFSDGWKNHPLSSDDDHKTPDTAWMPSVKNAIDSYWDGQLDYTTIRNIIPAPTP